MWNFPFFQRTMIFLKLFFLRAKRHKLEIKKKYKQSLQFSILKEIPLRTNRYTNLDFLIFLPGPMWNLRNFFKDQDFFFSIIFPKNKKEDIPSRTNRSTNLIFFSQTFFFFARTNVKFWGILFSQRSRIFEIISQQRLQFLI